MGDKNLRGLLMRQYKLISNSNTKSDRMYLHMVIIQGSEINSGRHKEQ